MNWIVLQEKNGKIILVSQKGVVGMLPKGSFLTVEQEGVKFILRVDSSAQHDLYNPHPLVVDMDLKPLEQDRTCKNLITAYRVHDISNRKDGLIDYIKPMSLARRSNQKEIDLALSSQKEGPKVFVATVQYDKNQLLIDDRGNYITARLPKDMFFHQMLIAGKTGSGKTVSIKYLTQYFVEKMGGAVLAINVKDVDLLKMDKPSEVNNKSVLKEWKVLDESPHGIDNYVVYYPANTDISPTKGITPSVTQKITLDVAQIEPESLAGLLQNISDIGAMNLPNIFRAWREERRELVNKEEFSFSNFVQHFRKGEDDKYEYRSLNTRGEESFVKLHRGTFDNILRNLDVAIEFFDNEEAKSLDESDVLVKGKMSVIDVSSKNGIQFGSILLRHLLSKIVTAKSEQRYDVPVLIIIDEVHMFYNTDVSLEALGDLDTICRTGRSQKIGIIFSSQNPQDIPRGLTSVINTKIFFKSDPSQAKMHGISLNASEVEGLDSGFAVCSVYNLSQLKVIKFPLAYSGVFD